MNETKYIPYLTAYAHLSERISATPEEFAGWIFLGKKDGGLDAYLNADFEPTTQAKSVKQPPRFFYASHAEGTDYLADLPRCWFAETDIEAFSPHADARFVTGRELFNRWKYLTWRKPRDFAVAKIRESTLMDFHPITGGTDLLGTGVGGSPPLEDALFLLSHVIGVEESELQLAYILELSDVSRREPDSPRQGSEFPQFKDDEAVPPNAGAEIDADVPYASQKLRTLKPPQRHNDWWLVIHQCIHQFNKDHGRPPGMQEAWVILIGNPPAEYGVSYDKKKNALYLEGKSLPKKAFKERWKRYFPSAV